MTALPSRCEIWWCELPDASRRPVVVLSRNVAIARLGRAVVAPCSTRIRGLPSEVVPDPAADPVPVTAAVGLDAIRSVSVDTLTERLGRLGHARMREVGDALTVALDCE